MENKNPELMVLPATVLQEALNYLATRPYMETAKIIETILKTAAKVGDQESKDSSGQA